MKGNRSIFQSLFNDIPVTETLALPKRKGRCEDLLNERNELLIARYYYYSKIKNLRYEKVLQILTHEIFLTERTIIDAISNNILLLKTYNQKKTSIRMLREQFPFMSW